jgi:hypothetical protein
MCINTDLQGEKPSRIHVRGSPFGKSDRLLGRRLRRHAVGSLKILMPKHPRWPHKTIKSYVSGNLHMDVKCLPEMADENRCWHLFVAIDRVMRWVLVHVKYSKTADRARNCLKTLHNLCPNMIAQLLPGNGKEFIDSLFSSRARHASRKNEFDQLCQQLTYLASLDQTAHTTNQLHGRAFQWPHYGCTQDTSL